MDDLTSSEAKKISDHTLDWETVASSKAYPNVAYSFKDNAKEDFEGRKEKPRMNYSLNFC